MLTLVVAMSVVLVAVLSLVWWMGSKPEQPIVVKVVEAAPKAPKAAKVTAPKAPRRKRFKADSPKPKVAPSALVCPHCKATSGRRGAFLTKAHLGAHVGRCKSRKK